TELLASPIYANVRKTYARLAELVGHPPYTIAFAKKARVAETFSQLREMALELAKEGIQVSRFKGLGEMDAEELAETTMNPANRMLVRVDAEDAAAARQVFCMFLGAPPHRPRPLSDPNPPAVSFPDVCRPRAARVGKNRVARARGGNALELPR